MHWSAARSALLCSAVISLVTSCHGPSDEPGESTQALSGVHRVQASGAAAEQLLARGARLIAEYESYALFEVDGARLAGMPKGSFMLRDEYRNVLLNAGTIDALDASSQRLRETTLPAAGRQLHLVQFAGTVKPEWYAALQATGVRVVAYIPHNAYLVWGDSTSLSRMLAYGKSAPEVQWDGPYLNDYKLNPRVYDAAQPDGWEVQLVEDGELNAETLAKASAIEQVKLQEDRSLGYVNLVLHTDRDSVLSLARQPDVVSIIPFYLPKKLDERANMLAAGQLTGNGPSGPGYLAWLTARGFTQAQFDASGIGVDVSDSGLDNATPLPNHYALYTGGNVGGASRVVYARLEGTPHNPSVIQGCDGHGTINAHIISAYSTLTGGPHSDALGFRYNLGIAPFVRVGSSVVFDPSVFTNPDFEDLQSRAYRDGMRVSSNSWGAAVGGAYNASSQRYDALVRDAQPTASAVPNPGNQEMVIVFAAGNSGSTANTVGSPATGKNVITAGAAENVHPFGGADGCSVADSGADSANDIIGFSSRGPCDDGRIKPDLVAAGTHVSGGVFQVAGQRGEPPANANGQADACFDASGACAGPGSSNFWPLNQQWTTASSGTSHSTPLIAGAAALTIQRMINNAGTPPSAAMVKALLMNGTRYMTGTGANDNLYSNAQGMGHLDLSATLDDTARTLRDQAAADLFTASGQSRTFNIFVSDPAKPFRVTLAWTDAPGSTTGNAFNNNLDLTVTVGSNTYRGNVFTGRNSVTGGTADIRNNVESVFLPAGVTGPATVTVTATNIVSDGVPGNGTVLDQDFALVIYNVCDTQPGAPTGATASVPGPNQIQIDWTPPATGNVVEYHLYRSTTAGGPYTQVGTAPNTATTFTDSTVSGGTTYFYVVRAVDCAESANSNEVSATATGDCRLPPVFAGLATADNAQATTCGVNLSWTAATPSCSGPITYNVYRSRTAGFTPNTGNRIASGVTGTSYSDTANLVYPNTYYYVVRAVEVDGASSTEENNTVQRSVQPTGAVTPGLSYFDDLDGNRPPTNPDSYWTTGGTGATSITRSSCHWQSSNTAWRFGATTAATCPGTYANSLTPTLTLGGTGGFTFPTGMTGTLSFRHAWELESGFDGVILEFSTTGPTGTFTKILPTASTTAPYITAGGYNNSNSALSTCWGGIQALTNGQFLTTTVNVDALAGRTAWFRWRYRTDGSIVDEGHYLDDVRITTSNIASCTPGAAPPGPAASYVVTLPATSPAGTAVTADFQARDALEQVATGYAGTAGLATSDAQAVIPATVTFAAGVASASVTFGSGGLQTLTASDSTDNTIRGTGGTMVTAGAAAGLRFSVQPSNTAAGVSIAPAVRVQVVDQFGNLVSTATDSITVALGANPSGGTLRGTTTVAAVAGVATFSTLNIQEAATGYTLVATSGTLTSVTSSAFNIVAAAPNRLSITQEPSNAAAGDSINPAIAVRIDDQYGNPVANAALPVTIQLQNNPSSGTLFGTLTRTTAGGTATFGDLFIDKVGTGYTLRASSGTLTPVTSAGFDISPAAPHRLVITRQPADTTVGTPISTVTVIIEDRFANLATQSFAPISAALRGGTAGAQLIGTNPVFANAGIASFDTLAVDRAGLAYALDLGSTGLFGATTVGFDVAAGTAPVAVEFVTQPRDATAGAAISPDITVRVVDAAGNTAVGATELVTLALGNNPSNGSLSGGLTATPVNGVATFSGVSINRSGTGYTLVAGSGALTSDTSDAFNVSAAAAAALVFSAQPTNGVAGQSISAVTVQARDAFGNLDTAFSGSVTVALGGGDPAATLSGTTTASATAGVATFSDLSIDRAASGYTLAASSGALTSATSNAFAVRAGAATQLAFRAQPSNSAAGRSTAPAVTVEARDASGNLDTTFNGLVTVALAGGNPSATLSGTTTASASGGVVAFSNLSVDRVGSGYTLSASSGSLAGATSNAFNVSAGSGRQLAFNVQPSNAAAGQAIAPAVAVEVHDAFGNLDTTFNGSVTVVLGGGNPNATLSGTTTATASSGVATFSDLSVNRSGRGYTLAASANGVTGGNSSPFNVSSGPAAKYVISGLGQSATAAVEVSFTIQAYDAQDNLATDYSGTAQLTSNDASAALPANVTFASGVANNVRVMFRTTGVHTLTATDTSTASLSASASLVVTNFPQPRVSITSPNNGAAVTGTVTITAEGAVSVGTTLTRLEIFVNGTSVANGNTSPLSASWDVTEMKKDTTHLIHAVVTDAAGNVVQSTPLTVIIGQQGCGCSTGAGGADMALLAAMGAALRAVAIRRRRAKK